MDEDGNLTPRLATEVGFNESGGYKLYGWMPKGYEYVSINVFRYISLDVMLLKFRTI